MSNKKQKLEIELVEVKSIKKCCEIYFKKYNKDNKFRDAWLAVRKKRYQEIVDAGFYRNDGVIFRNEVMKFWKGIEENGGWSYRNSMIRKKSGGWIIFQDENGETPNSEEIIKELKDLELHGNYSWSQLKLGVNHGDIIDDMEKLEEVIGDLLNKNIDIVDKFNKAIGIIGMGHGKASALLHIIFPDEYGVWNGCTNATFKIFSKIDSGFSKSLNSGGNNISEKYKKINNGLKYLLKEYEFKKYKNGFKNLSDVDIFMWYVSDNFELRDGKVFFKKII